MSDANRTPGEPDTLVQLTPAALRCGQVAAGLAYSKQSEAFLVECDDGDFYEAVRVQRYCHPGGVFTTVMTLRRVGVVALTRAGE